MENELTYIKGFNSGYKLAEYTPELWEKLKPSLSQENDYERGVLEGGEEYDKDRQKGRESEIENARNGKGPAKDADLSR